MSETLTFRDLGLPESLLNALLAVGYETPSPIQANTIPPLLEGRDVLGQAQTGTGKTAAFALPILANIDLERGARKNPQALVLAPTRELAIQVAEAFQRYASHLPGFHVLPIYGGQSYTPQIRGLERGAHVVVGTPGRIIDHIDKGTLNLSNIDTLVLDEADEMLRMGFVDDVEQILKHIPEKRRIALFSATMSRPIARIAETYLRDPVRVAIVAKTTTASTVRQRFWNVSGLHKLDALTRILEVESFDAMIVFSRTKIGTEELAEKLEARGFRAAAINGDVIQSLRERTIQKLKDGQIDILVATDVAARGLDVERISHVINFDIPVDTESYVHRIGRTGRAGRSGEAILFVTPRERHLLKAIERATRQPIEPMILPSVGAVNEVRITKFKERIQACIAQGGFDEFREMLASFEQEQNIAAIDIAAALAKLLQGKKPLLLNPERESAAFDAAAKPTRERSEKPGFKDKPSFKEKRERSFDDRGERPVREKRFDRDAEKPSRDFSARKPSRDDDSSKETFKVQVGHMHHIKPGNLVGAIANEAGLDSQYIGRIDIFDDYTLIDLPAGIDDETLRILRKVRVAQTPLQIERWDGKAGASKPAPRFVKARKFDDGDDARPRKPARGDTFGGNADDRSEGRSKPPKFASFGDKPKPASKFKGKANDGFGAPKRKPKY